MNFFERQAMARRQTYYLMFLFVIAVIAMIVIIDFAFLLMGAPPEAMLPFSILIAVGVVCASLVRLFMLHVAGPASIGKQLGASQIEEGTQDPTHQRLRNIVEEIAIASSVPVPQIYILKDEESINALAAGFSPSDAVVAVTKGALTNLNRDELQGVVAHEFSHVLNGDMRLNLRMMSLLFGITFVALCGKRIIYVALRSRSKNALKLLMAGGALFVFGYLGVLCARLIKASINRQREYLADASAVQYTRLTVGLTGALKKIALSENGSAIQKVSSEEVSHMFFSDSAIISLIKSHPPIIDRIKALDPKFDTAALGSIAAKQSESWIKFSNNSNPDAKSQKNFASYIDKLDQIVATAQAAVPSVTPAVVIEKIGAPTVDHYDQAANMIAGISPVLQQAARNYYGVFPLLFAMLYAKDEKTQAIQNQALLASYSKAVDDSTRAFSVEVGKIDASQRLPLLSLAFPALRQHPQSEIVRFMETVQAMIHADGEVSLHEYCLGHLLSMQIRDLLTPGAAVNAGNIKLQNAATPVSVLLTVLAQSGTDDRAVAEQAYLAGMSHALPDVQIDYQPKEYIPSALDAVWPDLEHLDLTSKARLIEAVVMTIQFDKKISINEAELLRAICASLHCPLPAIV